MRRHLNNLGYSGASGSPSADHLRQYPLVRRQCRGHRHGMPRIAAAATALGPGDRRRRRRGPAHRPRRRPHMAAALPYLKIVGGIALIFIAAKLLRARGSGPRRNPRRWRICGARCMIIAIADIVMSIDNMVAIAAIAQGNLLLLAIGLAVSIPLIVAGAALVIALLEPFPILIWAGTALLGWIAGEPHCRRCGAVAASWPRASADNSPSRSNSPRPATGAGSQLPRAACGVLARQARLARSARQTSGA